MIVFSFSSIKKIFKTITQTLAFSHLRNLNRIENKSKIIKKRKNTHSNSSIDFEETKSPEKEKLNAHKEIDDLIDDLDSDSSKSIEQNTLFGFNNINDTFEKLLRNFLCPLKVENEIFHFQEIMKKIKSSQKEIFDKFIESLDEKQKINFYEILGLKKIETGEEEKNKRVFRKIIHAKGKKNLQNKFQGKFQDPVEIDY